MHIVGIVCACLLVLIAALLLCRVGVVVEYTNAGLRLQVRAGFLRITLLPRPEKAKEGRERTKQEKKKPKKQKQPKAEQKDQQGMMEMLRESGSLSRLKALFDLVLDAAGQTIRYLRIEYLRLHYIFAGQPDPARAALECGYANVGGDVICGLLEAHMRILERQVTAEVDFCSEASRVYAAASCSIRVGAGLTVGLKLCRGYFVWKKQQPKAVQEEKTYG